MNNADTGVRHRESSAGWELRVHLEARYPEMPINSAWRVLLSSLASGEARLSADGSSNGAR